MSWKPTDTYQEDLIPGKVYEGWVKGITKGGSWLEIDIETTGGARQKERRYLTPAAKPWTERFFSGLYYATEAGMTTEVKDFEDAAAHDANLKGKHFKFILKQKKDSVYMEITLTARMKDELTYKPQAPKAESSDPFATQAGADAGDAIPF